MEIVKCPLSMTTSMRTTELTMTLTFWNVCLAAHAEEVQALQERERERASTVREWEETMGELQEEAAEERRGRVEAEANVANDPDSCPIR